MLCTFLTVLVWNTKNHLKENPRSYVSADKTFFMSFLFLIRLIAGLSFTLFLTTSLFVAVMDLFRKGWCFNVASLYHNYQVAYSRNGIDWFWYPSNDKTYSYPTLARAEAAALFCRTTIANYSRIYSIFNLAAPCLPDESWIVHQGRWTGPILGKNV